MVITKSTLAAPRSPAMPFSPFTPYSPATRGLPREQQHKPESDVTTKVLVSAEMCLSSLILILGFVTSGMAFFGNNHIVVEYRPNLMALPGYHGSQLSPQPLRRETISYFQCCIDGSSLWGGACLVASSIVGILGMFRSNRRNCRVAFFVLAIISAVISGIICIMQGIWAARTRAFGLQFGWAITHYHVVEGLYRMYTLRALLIVIAVIAFVNMILFVCSATFWCYNWCSCCKQSNEDPGVQMLFPGLHGYGGYGTAEQGRGTISMDAVAGTSFNVDEFDVLDEKGLFRTSMSKR